MPFDFEAAVSAPFRMQPGLRRVAPGTPQLTPSAAGGRHLQEKLAVLRSHPTQALLAVDGFDPRPALQGVVDELAALQPQPLRWTAAGGLEAPRLGWRIEDGHPSPMHEQAIGDVGAVLADLAPQSRLTALVALALEEDLAIVDGRSATLPWLAVCLPSHWAPEAKIGRHFAAVHAPVADNTLLLAAGERLLKLACGPDRWERLVWTLTRQPTLRAHPAHAPRLPWPADGGPAELAALAWFRSEHQTFIPLPERQQAVFTIHVDVRPLAEVAAAPGRAARLSQALSTMSDAVLDYRGLAEARDRLVAWLDAIGASSGGSGRDTSGAA